MTGEPDWLFVATSKQRRRDPGWAGLKINLATSVLCNDYHHEQQQRTTEAGIGSGLLVEGGGGWGRAYTARQSSRRCRETCTAHGARQMQYPDPTSMATVNI